MSQIRTAVRALFDALNAHDLTCASRWIDTAYNGVDTGEACVIEGRRELAFIWNKYVTAFPDLQLEITDWLERDNEAAVVWRATGTHLGELQYLPPSGLPIEVRGTWMICLERGRIRRGTNRWSAAALLEQLQILLPVLV
jgi:steroid delta-isomerase-like uncharacterized protein